MSFSMEVKVKESQIRNLKVIQLILAHLASPEMHCAFKSDIH
jgi:hypothetical protein